MSEVSLEGTGDTPYNFLTPYETPYIYHPPNPNKKPKPRIPTGVKAALLIIYFVSNLWKMELGQDYCSGWL